MQHDTFARNASVGGQCRQHPPAVAIVGTALLTAILLSSCNSNEELPEATAQVSGTVKAKGRPVSSGVISLLNSGTSWQASIDQVGTFRISDPLPPGTYLVFVRATDGGTHPNVPEKYQSDTSTDRTVSLQPGSNNVTIDLK